MYSLIELLQLQLGFCLSPYHVAEPPGPVAVRNNRAAPPLSTGLAPEKLLCGSMLGICSEFR